MLNRLVKKIGVDPPQIGMALGWVTAMICVATTTEHHRGIEGALAGGFFIWGTIGACIKFEYWRQRAERYAQTLRAAGIDPATLY